MKKFSALCIALIVISCSTVLGNEKELKAFPLAEEGQKRHVIWLPKLDDEYAAKIEIIVGKTVEVDARNRFFLLHPLQAGAMSGDGAAGLKKQIPISSPQVSEK